MYTSPLELHAGLLMLGEPLLQQVCCGLLSLAAPVLDQLTPLMEAVSDPLV